MRKGINKMVGVRVALALASIMLFSVLTTINILRIEKTEKASAQMADLLETVQKAEAAHYRWAANLSNALYAGAEFTGSTDYTSCILGQWLYGKETIDDAAISSLRSQMETLHRTLHESASKALSMTPVAAQQYYQQTIQTDLSSLVGLLDQVVDRATALSAERTEEMEQTILLMHYTTMVGLLLSLLCLISLVRYVIKKVVRPILLITEKSKPLHDGILDLDLHYSANNELGDLAENLERSLGRIHDYVKDINRIMSQFSQGNFDVHTATDYIGDFRSIEESIDSFTDTMCSAFSQINQAERKVSGHAEQLSSSAQSLAQGATEQASAVQQLYATLDDLSKNASENVRYAASAQHNAQLTGEQVNVSETQMREMVAAMEDIATASQEISKIIATIENIAFQTNILALNAAVEAARAGSAGKGFAVVSDEVRSLAAQSDQAAKATKELIENSVRATEKGRNIVGEVSQTLQKTLDLVMQSNQEIGVIAGAVQGEAESIAQVTEGIGQISAVVQTNSASSEESAAVSAELFDQVRLLEAQTNRFRLKPNNRF